MKIKKITKKKNNTYELLFDDLTKYNFYDDVLIKYNLLTSNKDVDNKVLLDIIKYNHSLEAYYKSLKLINTKLRTKLELSKKLKQLGYENTTINNTIDRLVKEGYLNDQLYIKSYIADQVNLTLNGPGKINRELNNLKLDSTLIQKELLQYEDSVWLDKINKIIAKKQKANHNLSSKMLLLKINNDLQKMGYKKELISQVIENVTINDDNDILKKEYQKLFRKYSKKYNGDELTNNIKYGLYKKGFNMNDINKCIKNLD